MHKLSIFQDIFNAKSKRLFFPNKTKWFNDLMKLQNQSLPANLNATIDSITHLGNLYEVQSNDRVGLTFISNLNK